MPQNKIYAGGWWQRPGAQQEFMWSILQKSFWKSNKILSSLTVTARLPWWLSGKESACQCRRRKRTWVQSLDWDDLLEKEMTTDSSIVAWEIPWTEEPGGLQSMGLQRVRHDWVTEDAYTHCQSYTWGISCSKSRNNILFISIFH